MATTAVKGTIDDVIKQINDLGLQVTGIQQQVNTAATSVNDVKNIQTASATGMNWSIILLVAGGLLAIFFLFKR